MGYPSIYLASTTTELFRRIDLLNPQTQGLWGKMTVGQMLSHCAVPYEQILGTNTDQPPLFMRIILKLFLKKSMINEVPYKQNLPTAPSFIRTDQYDFEKEKEGLKGYIKTIQEMGAEKLAATPSLSLGVLSATEWNNLLYKHIDHHLQQFGV
ncbi:MAG: DUF1569 domain-containing protein [Cytophagaceae bacterium]|jgi:hypothetical protein|nr:DUF1569 domain-containing protein [Cytophagaceae bacterium]MBP6094627.1 DUF1569 domain-containing protein [Cytophagaceae bacterium]